MALKLIKLTKQYERQLCEMLDEWIMDIEENRTDGSPWRIFRNDHHDFENYLENLEQDDYSDGWVPDSVFFLLDDERDILLGAVNIRHILNMSLEWNGGHIGYGIRPSERRKGYGTVLLGLALEECRKIDTIESVMVVCGKSNVASAKIIVRSGGVLEDEILNPDRTVAQRYRITL